MKPLHIGLLVVGAALAGGVAVRMSEQQPFPHRAVSTPAAVAPAPVIPPPVKSTPVVQAPAETTKADLNEVSAPPPVYTEPPVKQTKPSPLAVPRKSEPKSIQVARNVPLTTPGPYVAPPSPASSAVMAPAPPEPAQPVHIVSAPEPESGPRPSPRSVTLRTGAPVVVRVDESLSSERNAGGDTFSASLAEPLVIDGLVIAERGSRVTGRILNSYKAGRLSGSALLELSLSSVTTMDGQKVDVSTEPWAKRGDSSSGRNAAKIGGGAALGAIIGAIAGGGPGAAIGAGVGGAAGIGTVAASRGKPATVPSETVIRFRLASSVTITERL
jgi:hypothetical protein